MSAPVSSALTIDAERAAPVVHAPAASESAAIFQIIERAARDPNVDLDKMERLMAMHERMNASRARAAYADAFASMQPNLPIIPEHGKGHNNASYALWEDINELVKPVLAQFGFGLSFRVRDAQGGVEIVASLFHREGHTEETAKTFPLDSSGSKNAIQAQGSTISYGKRYTAAALLNLTSRKEDDDGGKGGGAPVEPKKSSASLKKDGVWDAFLAEVEECGTTAKLGIVWKKWIDRAKADNWPAQWRTEAREVLDKAFAELKSIEDREASGGRN